MNCKALLRKTSCGVMMNRRHYIDRSNRLRHLVFDREAKRRQRERAVLDPEHKIYDYLKEEVGYRLFDNLYDIQRRFSKIVEIGCGKGFFSRHLTSDLTDEVIMCDSSSSVLDESSSPGEGVRCIKKVMDEEEFMFEPNSLDLVVSCLSLHWVNDLPGTFSKILSALKQDGAFLGSLFGTETLYEMRSALQLADMERYGGIAAHVSPFTSVQDIGNLLSNTGYTLLTLDNDEIIIGYPSLFELMWDLKGMGENNAALNRCNRLNKDSILAAAAIYEHMYGEEGKIRATFQIINFIAWKPDPSQPKPLARGTPKISLKDLDKFNSIIKAKGSINLNEDKKKK